MKPGDSLTPYRHRVDPAAMAQLAGILRDPNPIHLDAKAAAAAGLGDRVVNQGPANLAYIVNMLTAAFPNHRLLHLESRYLANVFGDDIVEAGGEVTNVIDREVTCEAWLKREDGTIAVSAIARLGRRG